VPERSIRSTYLTQSAVGTAPPPPKGDGDPIVFNLDGKEVTARPGQLLIAAAEENGVYIPRFCYHPRMKPVGMCRMCLVEVEGPRGPSVIPACYSTVSAGMEVRTTSPMAKKAQEGVLEFLLVNHPLDCPVCDKGGECPLQDQTLAWGPGESRFVEEKRHWAKPTPISELVYLDRERCIQCGRCVRFADEVAGDALIDFADRGDRTEVATYPNEPYSSYFSGNVVQICPVGALTARLYRFKARPWDLEQAESTCTTCSFGCRVAVQSSQGELTRLVGVDSDPVNWGWLCDKGRFAFLAASAPDRLTTPLVRRAGELVEASWTEALDVAAEALGRARDGAGGDSIAVIGGARLANEDAYAWSKLARVALGTDHLDSQVGDGLPAQTVLGLPRATIDQACSAHLVITLSGDIKEELPVLYLRLRHAVVEGGSRIVELTPAPTGLSRYAEVTALYRPGESAARCAAITSSGEVTGAVAGVERETIEAVRDLVQASGQRAAPGAPCIVVVLGRPSLADSEEQVAAAARLLAGLPGVAFLPALRRGNVCGALDMGLAPGVLPGRVGLDEGRAWFEHHWAARLPRARGLGSAGILEAAARGHIAAAVLLGADPRNDFPDTTTALKGLEGARFCLAVDTHLSESASRHADVVLPAAAWAERHGSFTNIEGRVSWLAQKVAPRGLAWPDWMIACELGERMGVDLGFASIEEIWEELGSVSPLHQGLTPAALGGDGVVVPASGGERPRLRRLDPLADHGIASTDLQSFEAIALAGARPITGAASAQPGFVPGGVARAPTARASGPTATSTGNGEAPPMPPMLGVPAVPAPDATVAGGTAASGEGRLSLRLVVRRTLWDAGSALRSVPVLAGLAPRPRLRVHPSVLAGMGVADGEEVRVRSSRGSLVVEATGDATLPEYTALLSWNLPGLHAGCLIDSSSRATVITLEEVS
jgi:NADH-quinone oxidoreductase subunit G